MSSYWFAGTISLVGHGILLLLIAMGWQFGDQQPEIQRPNFIKASLVELEAKAKPTPPKSTKPKPKEEPKKPEKAPPKKVDLTKQRLEQERQKKEAAEKVRQQKLKQQKAEQAKKQAEKKAKDAEIARQKEEQAKREAEAKQQAREDLLENLNREREQLTAEREEAALTQQAEADEELIQSVNALIQQRVEENWSRPLSARNNMKAVLQIQLVPTGEVINVSIAESSGSASFDRSAIQAVKKARNFPEIKNMPSRVFESEYRSFKLSFNPQDLRQ